MSEIICTGCNKKFEGDKYGDSPDFDMHKCPSLETGAEDEENQKESLTITKLCSDCNEKKPEGECQQLYDKWGNPTGNWQCEDCTYRWRDMMEAHQIDIERKLI